MKRISILLISLVLINCSSRNQVEENDSTKSDSIAQNDKCFNEFIYQFMVYDDFQQSRTKIDNWKYKNYFAEKDYTMHFYQSFDLPEKEFETDLRKIKYMTIVDLNSNLSSIAKFIKENDKWSLVELTNNEFKRDSVIDFETFLYQFSTDTMFMKKHIKFPLKYSFADPENDFADSTQYLDSNSDLKYNFFEKNYLIYFHYTPKIEGNKIMIFLRGIENGLNIYYYFEKIENQWTLIEENDYST